MYRYQGNSTNNCAYDIAGRFVCDNKKVVVDHYTNNPSRTPSLYHHSVPSLTAMSQTLLNANSQYMKNYETFTDVVLKILAQNTSVRDSGYQTCLEYGMSKLSTKSDDLLCTEFGVFSGGTMHVMATARPRATIIGFDSFEGLPDKWRNDFEKGAFNLDGQIPIIPSNSAVFRGWFDETVPRFKKLIGNRRIDLMHMDADMYVSTKIALDGLRDNIREGTYVVFDELLNYPGFEEHELKALYDFCMENPAKSLEVIGMIGFPVRDAVISDSEHQQAVVRIH